ncbi:MAG: hypothetical protein IPO93_18390 [Actinobacteria bacterium]|nr:hypothetical protein [Actinomycetota bacterium]
MTGRAEDVRVPVVHFPHPGREHDAPALGRFAWSSLPVHRRKFLRGSGSYADAQGRAHRGRVVFWGEWEAASDVVETWPPEASLPTALHVPVRVGRRRVRPGDQNTDPWVFGDHFRYTNCRQRGSMKTLPAGSLLLFGSTIGGEFALDTVFVVRDSSGPLTLSKLKRHAFCDDVLKASTYDPLSGTSSLACGPEDPTWTYVLYRGATPVEQPDMFSYSPAKPARAGRFSRPIINLGRRPSGEPYVNPANWRSTKGAPKAQWVPAAEARRVWDDVREQVLGDGQGLVLAHHIDSPATP